MITDKFNIRPRYDEVDQMGYVYHANHITYCHQARTELLRKFGLNDAVIEENGIMLPVISFDIKYKVPALYDQELSIITRIREMPRIRFSFEFEIYNQAGKLVSKGNSEVVFVDKKTRKPMMVPPFVKEAFINAFDKDSVVSQN